MKKVIAVIYVIAIASLCLLSCSKSNDTSGMQQLQEKDSAAEILSYTINEMDPLITISPLSINILFDDTVYDPKNLTASFTLSPGASATILGTVQQSGETKNNYNAYLNYSVKNESGVVKHWIVTSTNNNYTAGWGLGNFLKQWHTNDRPYNWYYTQAGTGAYANINCGPTSVTMAMKWADSSFNSLPADARNYFPSNTGLWSFNPMQQYMADHFFQNKYIILGTTAEEGKNTIKQQIDAGNIVILLLNTGNIRSYVGGSMDSRTDKFYPDNFNHFIVAYGYKEVDGEFFFQVNDPWNWGWLHDDGTPECKNRYYRSEDIYNGCMAVDGGALVVYKK